LKHSSDRILTSHAGALPRPPELREQINAKDAGQPYDAKALATRVQDAVQEVVKKQVEAGIDVVNDGEESKTGFSNYARERLSGLELQDVKPGEGPAAADISGRDQNEFTEYFAARGLFGFGPSPARRQQRVVCTGPIAYIGHEAARTDIENLRTALHGAKFEEAFLPAIAPGTVEHWLHNEYYPSDEAFLYAIADAMHQEYKAIADSGFILQVDDPDLPDAWQIHPELDVAAYRRFANLRVEALNHALQGIPTDRVRFHTCWGSYHGPHKYDVPLRDIVDLILRVDAEVYSIEASNPCHEHEWRVWEDVKLPDGKALMPGVVGHYCDFIEHPELVAERLVRYAELLGRENVIAGTDCGLGPRVGHPTVCWAKFEAMAEGARLATNQLWGCEPGR
jgi:5-methyltetrahydropteroyltriglutamate--homocysteine methyltransferase